MDSVQNILTKVLHRRGLKTQASASLVTFKAQQWLANALPKFASLLTVDKLQDGTVTISAGHSIAAQECQQILPALRFYLQRECKSERVEEIRLVRERKR